MKKTNFQKGNAFVGLLVVGLVIWGIISLFSNNDNSSSSYSSYSNYDESSDYNDDEDYEMENPYNEGSGHSAGYEWAQENEPSSCGGNSQSFIEGCEEYMSQLEREDSEEYEE